MSGIETVSVALGDRSYDVVIGSSALKIAAPGTMNRPAANAWRFVLPAAREFTLSMSTQFEVRSVEATIVDGNEKVSIKGRGTGPVDGFLDALSRHLGAKITVLDYAEHSLQRGSDAAAICYMEIDFDGERVFGAAINKNIVAASLDAIISAVNRRLVT